MTACGINVRGRSRQLRLSYRTSDEIRKWAVSILEGVSVDDFDEGADSLNGYTSVFRGPAPELADFSSEGKEVDALVEWLLAIKAQGTQLSDVGILLRTSSQIDHLTRKLADANIQNIRLRPNMADDRGQPGVRLSTMHRSKGLEFQAVAIPFLAKSVFASPALMRAAADEVDRRSKLQQEKSLLHVAATRAKKLLRVSWSGEPSALIVMPNDI
jgi:superfamily I DNA/RNA helicase